MKVIKFFCISKSPPPPPRAWWMFCPISYESGSTREWGRGIGVGRRERGQNRREGEWKISPSRGSAVVFASFSRHRFVSSGNNDLIAVSDAMHRCACYVITRINLIYYTGRPRERENDTKIFQQDHSTGKVKGYISRGTRILHDCKNLFAQGETCGKHMYSRLIDL